jgi:predicted nucleic acid-binding protein
MFQSVSPDFVHQMNSMFIVPYVQPVDRYCGRLFHQLREESPNTFYPNTPPSDIYKLYLDPTVFMALILRRTCTNGHEPWKSCLELLSMIHDGDYEAVTRSYNFDTILPDVMSRELTLRVKADRSRVIEDILSQLRRITYLQVLTHEHISPNSILNQIDKEDAIQFGAAVLFDCDRFVTYDSHFLALHGRHKLKICVPEQLVPKPKI